MAMPKGRQQSLRDYFIGRKPEDQASPKVLIGPVKKVFEGLLFRFNRLAISLFEVSKQQRIEFPHPSPAAPTE